MTQSLRAEESEKVVKYRKSWNAQEVWQGLDLRFWETLILLRFRQNPINEQSAKLTTASRALDRVTFELGLQAHLVGVGGLGLEHG